MPATPLKDYHRKRDFARTPEPRGKVGETHPHPGLSYLIQKHAASHLHYDFRLELGGTLKSWAVPKGPSLDPEDRRLAMHVEDHPLEYGDFEGIIPAGEYGGGTVMLWDRGTWEPVGDAEASYRQGKLHFRLHGEKLKGGWLLVRMKREEGGKESWLLRKERDETARPGGTGIVEELPDSVVSGRSLEQIARDAGRTWHSNREPEPAAAKSRRRTRTARPKAAPAAPARLDPGTLAGARRAPLPAQPPPPQLATLASRVPEGEDWLHELKFDGYRILARVEHGTARLWSRNGKDWTDHYPEVARAVALLPLQGAILDGEVVVLMPDGTTSFQALQKAASGVGQGELHYMVFDLLHLDGWDLRAVPLEARKEALAPLVAAGGTVSYSKHVRGGGADVLRAACDLALEGVVSKRAQAPYASERNRDWIKTKCIKRQELVIVGWSDSDKAGRGLRSLLLGVHDEEGRLRYAGKVGTGFSEATLRDLRKRLAPLERPTSPLAAGPKLRQAHWVEPRLVAEVEFTEWTADGQLRHPSFQGLREDKAPAEVVREEPVAAARAGAAQPPSRPRPRRNTPVAVGGIRVTHPDKVLYPEQGLTKADLAAYYQAIADRILPYISDRVLSLVRCPEGRAKKCFYQKHAGTSTPRELRRVTVEEKDGEGEYLVIDDLAGLMATVQMGVLEIHVWSSRASRLEKPDQIVMDLDPDPALPWPRVVEAARQLRERLEGLGLAAFVKTTGGKGLHVVTPLVPRLGWDEVKAFTHALAVERVRADPKSYVAVMTKARRTGKIYVDYLRNDRGSTAIAPYSTRAREGAPVATPIAWEELERDVRSAHFNLTNLRQRLASLGRDPWADFDRSRVALTKKMLAAVGVKS